MSSGSTVMGVISVSTTIRGLRLAADIVLKTAAEQNSKETIVEIDLCIISFGYNYRGPFIIKLMRTGRASLK